MVDASLPFITQLNLLVRPSELRGLTADLRPTMPALAQLTLDTIPLMRDEVRPTSSCVANVIYPWSQLTVPDQTFNASNGFPPRKVYVEAVDYLPGLAGESRNFDANGPYVRILGTGGTLTYSLQPGLFGQALSKIDAVQPQVPPGGHTPPFMENVPCETQAPIVRDQIRPFVIAARPLVRNLRPAAIDLANATPNLTKTLTVINHLANMLGYNPGTTEHGYL